MFYNQKFISPNAKGIRQQLANHGKYIAKNSKCKIDLNDGKEHGLFGDIGKTGVEDIQKLDETVKYILDKATKDRVNIYCGLISLSTDEIKRSGFESRKRWENLIANKIHIIANQNNIKIQNLEWVGAYHVKKTQSHCHIMFWDKNEQIKQPFIPRQVFAKKMEHIRKEFAKTIFEEDFQNLYRIQDEAFYSLNHELNRLIVPDNTEEESRYFKDMFASTSAHLSEYDMINPYFTKRQVSIVLKELIRIKSLLPRSGSLKYGYLASDIKEEIDKVVQKIIDSNQDCKKAYAKYIQSAIDIRKIYSPTESSLNDAKAQAVKTVNRDIGNKLLKSIKAINTIETDNKKGDNSEESENAQKNSAINSLLARIAFALSRGANSNKAKIRTIKNDELSKQAKIELAKKLESKGIDWGQYER